MPAFVCSEQNCGLAFRRREHLIRHERRHTNSKPFSCSQCSRLFSRRLVARSSPRSDGELALLIHLGSDVLKRHILHHEKSTPSSRSASACDFCHRRKVKCDGREECARCREANRVCRRARRIPNSDPFPRESLPADTEISIHCSNAEADDQVVASLLATSHHSPRNRSESTDDARSNLNLPQPEQHPRENLRQDVTNPEESHRMEPDTASENHAGSTSHISDLLSINVFGSGLQETSFLGLHELPPPSSRETCSVDSQRVYLEHTSPVHPSSERRPEVDRGSERDEANYSEPSSGHVLPDTQTVNFQQARSIGPPDTTGGRRASVQASNDRHNSENNDALALLGLSQSSAPGPNIFQSWEESLQASLAQSPNTNTSASGHRRQSEASYEMDELTALHSKSRTQLDFHSPRGETAWEGMSVGTPGGHSPAVFPVFPIPVELGHASAAILDKRMFDRYFSSFHNHWPILHKASFSQPQCTPELQHAVGLIGGLLEGDPDLRAPSIRLHKWLSQRVLLQAIERPSDIEHLEILQALLLNILFGWYIGETELVRMACMALPTLTMCTREAGYFRVEGVVAQDEKSASHVSRWLIREQKKRLAYAVFRLDCYLHLLRDYPPSIRVPELCLHYPCSEVAWNATTVGDWELALAREPLGRMDKTYSLTCMQALSDTIRPNLAFLLPEDFETGVVAMQSRLWEEVQHEHETTLYSVSPSFDIRQASVGIAGYGLSWQVQLDMWRSTMDHLTGRNVGFCDKSTETWFYFTAKMQYHMSFLRMYADLTLIQRLIDGLSTNNYSPSLIRRFEARIQLWTKSSNAKQALWHAVQILQQFKETALGIKASRSLVCPSTVTCLFRAAQVVWAICRSVLSCDLCETSSAQHDNTWHTHRGVKAVYDLMELQNDGELGFWNDNRAKASIGNIPFCACHMPAILDLYIESLQMSTLGWSSVTPVTDALAALKLQQ